VRPFRVESDFSLQQLPVIQVTLLDSQNRIEGTFAMEEIARPVNIPEVILRSFIYPHFHVDGLAVVIVDGVCQDLGITVTSGIVKSNYTFLIILKIGLNEFGGVENIQPYVLVKEFHGFHPTRIVFFRQIVFWFPGENFSDQGAMEEEAGPFMRALHFLFDLTVGKVFIAVDVDAVDLDFRFWIYHDPEPHAFAAQRIRLLYDLNLCIQVSLLNEMLSR